MELRNWKYHPYYVNIIQGNIFNDEKGRFEDGKAVSTSSVLGLQSINGKTYAITRNSKYELIGEECK